MITQHLEDFMIKGKISIGCSDCLLWPDVHLLVILAG